MKTVTKTFYVRENYLNIIKAEHGFKTNFGTFEMKNYRDGDCQHEVRVSWEEEEKKVEITESQIDRICDECEGRDRSFDFRRYLKQEIFKEHIKEIN